MIDNKENQHFDVEMLDLEINIVRKINILVFFHLKEENLKKLIDISDNDYKEIIEKIMATDVVKFFQAFEQELLGSLR